MECIEFIMDEYKLMTGHRNPDERAFLYDAARGGTDLRGLFEALTAMFGTRRDMVLISALVKVKEDLEWEYDEGAACELRGGASADNTAFLIEEKWKGAADLVELITLSDASLTRVAQELKSAIDGVYLQIIDEIIYPERAGMSV